MRLSPRVFGWLGVVGLAIFVLAPSSFSVVLPVLAVAACLLGILFLARGATRRRCRSTARSDGVERSSEATTEASSSPITAEVEVSQTAERADQRKAQRARWERMHPSSGGDPTAPEERG